MEPGWRARTAESEDTAVQWGGKRVKWAAAPPRPGAPARNAAKALMTTKVGACWRCRVLALYLSSVWSVSRSVDCVSPEAE